MISVLKIDRCELTLDTNVVPHGRKPVSITATPVVGPLGKQVLGCGRQPMGPANCDLCG